MVARLPLLLALFLMLLPTGAEAGLFGKRSRQPEEISKAPRVQVLVGGLTSFKFETVRAAIDDQIEAIDEAGLSGALADDAAFFLGVFLRKNGYPHAEVTWEITDPNTLKLDVIEGPLTTIAAINVVGNSAMTAETIREVLLEATRERFPEAKAALPFVESDLNAGINRLCGLYDSKGYFDSSASVGGVEFSPDKKWATISVTVYEGPRYRFDSPLFHGVTDSRELLESLAPMLERPFTLSEVSNMERSAVYFYKVRGYYQAKVRVVSDPATARNGIVPLEFFIEPGPIHRFDGVTVTGLDRLRPDFLPKRFAQLSGTAYDPEALNELYREIMRTGLFKSLRMSTVATPDNEVTLHFEAEEAKAREAGFALGYGTFEGGIIGLSAGDRNLFGSGRPLRASIEISQRYQKGEILFLDPWFLDSGFALRLRLFGLTHDLDGYSKVEEGFRAELSRKLNRHLELNLFSLTRQVSLTNLGIDPMEFGLSDYLVSSLGAGVTLDTRDSIINPGRGWVINATVDASPGLMDNTLDFIRGTYRVSYYIPIRRALFSIGVRGGAIRSLGTQEIPIDERFFNGGSRSVRSFAERELGPRDRHGYPVGGETFSTFNAEYSFPLVGELEAAVFVDAGSVGHEIADWPGNLRYGVGAGLRYKLPVGPLRIDYGLNPSPAKDEAHGAFHVSFGVAF